MNMESINLSFIDISILGMAIVAGSYTIIGGLSSAINADMIQAFMFPRKATTGFQMFFITTKKEN